MIINDKQIYYLEKDVLKFWGFTHQPFELQNKDEHIYLDTTLQMQLDVLEKNLFHSDNLQILKGEKGVGKTTICQYFKRKIEGRASVFYLQGDKNLQASDAIKSMLKFYQNDVPNNLRSCIVKLASHVKKNINSHNKAIVFIDDCHLLPIKKLQIILQTMEALGDVVHKHLRLLLITEPAIELNLPKLNVVFVKKGKVWSSILRPFNLKQTKAYLDYRLMLAGLSAPNPFNNNKQLKKIFNKSSGIPSEINQQAAIFFNADPRQEWERYLAIFYYNWKPVTFVLVVLVVLLYTFITIINNVMNIEKSTITKEFKEDKEQYSNNKNQNSKVNYKTKIPPAPKIDPPTTPKRNVVEDIKKQSKIKMSQNIKNDDIFKNKKIFLDGEEFLKSQDDKNYTLQLIALKNLDDIREFKNLYNLHKNTYVYRVKKNSSIFYVLTLGSYKSVKLAKKAVGNLPDYFAVNRPWMRKLQSVKQAITNFNEKE
jgi:MSHA biogenesis protein MshM